MPCIRSRTSSRQRPTTSGRSASAGAYAGQAMGAPNDSVVWADGRYRGYIRLTLNRDRARADYVAVSDVESTDYRLRVLRRADIVSADGTLRYA